MGAYELGCEIDIINSQDKSYSQILLNGSLDIRSGSAIPQIIVPCAFKLANQANYETYLRLGPTALISNLANIVLQNLPESRIYSLGQVRPLFEYIGHSQRLNSLIPKMNVQQLNANYLEKIFSAVERKPYSFLVFADQGSTNPLTILYYRKLADPAIGLYTLQSHIAALLTMSKPSI
jgi:hypothetical protein